MNSVQNEKCGKFLPGRQILLGNPVAQFPKMRKHRRGTAGGRRIGAAVKELHRLRTN